ncbi:HLH transcription factor [Venturia nashicola]|uniref:HLH transcription factor n=1 Tax=Venturia nashicola TaxID=86259 RepID=A0A4Z1P8E5_9PEZI|nr:HLH transcription factor [Venturia nashicola]
MNHTPHSQPTAPFDIPEAFAYAQDGPSDHHDMVPSGQALLNNTEDDFINNFFLTQSQPDMSGSAYSHHNGNGQDHGHGTDMSSFNWLMNDPPPTFMGAAATTKQAPSPSPQMYHGMPPNTNFDFSAYHEHDLLQDPSHQNHLMSAASMLNDNSMNIHHHHNGHHHHMSQQTPSLVSAPSTMASVELMHTADVLPPTTSAQFYSDPPVVATQKQQFGYQHQLSELEPLATIQDVSLAGPHTAPARIDEPKDTRLYRFGSDSHFGANGFVPSSENEREEVVADRLTSELLMLRPINRSNNNTRAPTPDKKITSLKRSNLHQHDREQDESDNDDYDSRHRKRRRDSTEDDYGAKTNNGTRRVSTKPRLQRVSSVETGRKRRQSSISNSNKAPRENLTEEQKRSNHIQSEQKRRNLIKQGFDELHILVPELRAGGLSKSMVLTEAANYLDQLIAANNAMRQRGNLMKNG